MLRRRFKRQRVSDAPAVTGAATDEFDEGAWAEDAAEVDDTLAAVQLLASRGAAGFAAHTLPPLVLWHQLYVREWCLLLAVMAYAILSHGVSSIFYATASSYSVFPNRTFVDQNVRGKSRRCSHVYGVFEKLLSLLL